MNTTIRTLRVADLDAITGDSELYVLRDRLSEFAGPRVYFYSDKAPRVVSRNGEHYRVHCAESVVSYGETEPRLWVFLMSTNKRTGADYKSGKGIWTTLGSSDDRPPLHWLGDAFDVVEQFCIDAGLLVDETPTPVVDLRLPQHGGPDSTLLSGVSDDALRLRFRVTARFADRMSDTSWTDSRWPTKLRAEQRIDELQKLNPKIVAFVELDDMQEFVDVDTDGEV